MKCDRVRRTLLAAERPEPPPAEVRPHLIDCADCQAWLRRLGDLELRLPELPVPSSPGKERLLVRVREGNFNRAVLPALVKERGLKKLSVAFALAATVAAFAVGLWLWPRGSSMPARRGNVDPMAEVKTQRDKRMQMARAPSQRVKVLSDLVESLKDEAGRLARAADADRLEALANYFDRMVRVDLVDLAQTVPPEEQAVVLKEVRDQLERAESAMTRLAAEIDPAAKSLRQIASAAKEGDRRLRQLMERA